MSQKMVQLVIGQLITDEELRLRFLDEPGGTMAALRDRGFELTDGEIEALLQTDRKLWNLVARRIHPHLQRCAFRVKAI